MSQQTIDRLVARVLQRMEDRGLSQTSLAERLGISHSTVSRYLSGKRPITLHALIRIAEVLELPPASLLTDSNVDDRPSV